MVLLPSAGWDTETPGALNFGSGLFIFSRAGETPLLGNISDGCCLAAGAPCDPRLDGGLCDFRLLGAKVLESVPEVRGALPGPGGPGFPFSDGRALDWAWAGTAGLGLGLSKLDKGGTSFPSKAGGQPVRLLLSQDLLLQFL